MERLSSKDKIEIYNNLFKGRKDIFAVRWEKADKSASGYTPVCLNEWKNQLCLKLKKGKCKDCDNKKYPSLNENYIKQHLSGIKTYGIYPLLDDNTSCFIAADFDGDNWKNDSVNFIHECAKFNLPAYLERSRSGKGGHVWLFFIDKYPAYKSRKIIFSLLKNVKIVDQFDKEDSFDRLFPNQDLLSGKGIGNLIVLPLQGNSRKKNNSIFIDYRENFIPYEEQWEFLLNIEKIPIERLDNLYNEFSQDKRFYKYGSGKKLFINLNDHIYLNKSNLPKILVNFLKENLNFLNYDYIIKKRMGLNVYNIEKYFKLIETDGDTVAIPRGFFDDLCDFLNKHEIKYEIKDNRTQSDLIKYNSDLELFDYQREAVQNIILSDNGILVAPPGSGKTIIGIEILKKLQQRTLILVHKKQIYNQWIERIEDFLNIPKREIGQFGAGKKSLGEKVSVGMIQTYNRISDFKSISKEFGMIIVDECHHMPARMFRNVITRFNPYYLYGLTATPERKNNDAKLIFIYLGRILYTIKNSDISSIKHHQKSINGKPKIIIQDTDLFIPFKIKTDDFQILSKILIFDSNRNQKIVDDIKSCVNKNLRVLVLTERKDHVDVLNYYLKREYETITLTGDLKESERKLKIKQIKSNNFQILIATGQLIGEGSDFDNLDSLFLVYPFAFSGKLTQYIGRIQRGDIQNKYIYDYRDRKVEYLEKFFRKRLSYYKKYYNLS